MIEAKTIENIDVINPATGEILENIQLNSTKDLDQAVEQAGKAWPEWKSKTLRERAQVLYRYRTLLQDNIDELSQLIQKENGKTYDESKAEIAKAIEVTEFACSMAQFNTDKMLEVSQGITCRLTKEPLGVVACITPFNFPSMVPHWTIPIALGLGNCVILKPSELVPLSALRIKALLEEAGVPEHVFQVVFGQKEMVEAICDHPQIPAVSFVGSTKVAKIVYERCAKNHKRSLCMGGAKNHLIVLPDANVEMAANDIAASMSGCAGQRCMAASAMVAVGEVDHIIDELVQKAKGIVPGQSLGSVISCQAKERIESYITQAETDGATILLDGRGSSVEGQEHGAFVGPTIIDNVTPDMAIAKEEVFGPVLSILRCDTIDEAIAIQHQSDYGNGASVFTQSASHANYISARLQAGMIGVNIGVPVPREPFSFGGWNDSRFGVGDITGESSINFWTQEKKITTKWNPEDRKDWMS